MDVDDATGRWRDVPLSPRQERLAAMVADFWPPPVPRTPQPPPERLHRLAQLFGGLPVDRVPVATETARIDVRWQADGAPLVSFEDRRFSLDDRGRVLEHADGQRITWDRGLVVGSRRAEPAEGIVGGGPDRR